jgi:phage I-like protein
MGAMETTTIPGVELMKVGIWQSGSGPVDVTPARLAAVLAASQDTEVDVPVLKIGHYDQRFEDGTPALGYVKNQRLSADGNTLLGDITDVPVKLAEIAKSAYKRRSAELRFNVKTPSGRTHEATMTGLALLGVTPPAVKGMADLVGLYFSEPDPQVSAHTLLIESATTPEAKLSQNQSVSDDQGDPMDNEKEIREALGLDENGDILAAVVAAKAAKLSDPDTVTVSKAVFEDMQARLTKLDQAYTQSRVTAAIDHALSEGRIATVDIPKWEARLSAHFDEEIVRLSELAPVVHTRLLSDPSRGSAADPVFTDAAIASLIPGYAPAK